MKQRWEYQYKYLKTETRDEEEINRLLNTMAEDGWELMKIIVGTGDTSTSVTLHGYYFKREV